MNEVLNRLMAYGTRLATQTIDSILDDVKSSEIKKKNLLVVSLQEDIRNIQELITDTIRIACEELVIEKRLAKSNQKILALQTIVKNAHKIRMYAQCADTHCEKLENDENNPQQ